jgi:hypothetical protein
MPQLAGNNSSNLKKDTLQRRLNNKEITEYQRELIQLRLQYKEDNTLLTSFINKIAHSRRIYPKHLPTQASFRWSTSNPALTNWPRKCICLECPRGEHEWGDLCWSIRDILSADTDEFLLYHDHDDIEGRIQALVVNNKKEIAGYREGYDLHTITCCEMFNIPLPVNLRNPHSSIEDTEWRRENKWQGKDTPQRIFAKFMKHGSKYTKTHRFVHTIKGIEAYGLSYDRLEKLAKKYIEENQEAWNEKLRIMASIQRSRISRTLYGGRRIFYDSSEETGREGYSHMVSGTVSDFNNQTIIKMEEWLGPAVTILHNAHDGDKFAVHLSVLDLWDGSMEDKKKGFIKEARSVIERDISYKDRALTLTAGIKIAGI